MLEIQRFSSFTQTNRERFIKMTKLKGKQLQKPGGGIGGAVSPSQPEPLKSFTLSELTVTPVSVRRKICLSNTFSNKSEKG